MGLGQRWAMSADRSLVQCPGLGESNSRLPHISNGQCLKLCDDTSSVAMLLTLNNTQDLDPDYSEASFPVQWTPAHRSIDKPQCSVNGEPVHCPAQTWSHHSTNGECLAVTLVQVCEDSNGQCLFYLLVKVSFTMFWNSNRNHKALREVFTSLQPTLGGRVAKI